VTDRIIIEGPDGAFRAYIARPKALPAPAVVVLQELFGVNADIRKTKTCDELAEQGFVAVAPDLFWRQEPGVDLNVTAEADWQHGLRLYQAYDRDAGVRDIRDTLDTVAKLPECTGKIAVQGYCLGALMTFLTAVRCHVDAAVAYHGADTEKYLGEVGTLSSPCLSIWERRTSSFPSLRKPRSRQRHAFARHNGAHYNTAAAALANGRTSQFLHRQLR
jgi:carboxymethylenebutenolidase